MHLRVLKIDEKRALIDLAYHLFSLDAGIDDYEKKFINIYLHETMLDMQNYKPKQRPLQKILQNLRESSFIVKKSIYMELSLLIYQDHQPNEKEKKFLDLIKNEWEIDEEIYRQSITQAKEINDLQKKMHEPDQDKLSQII